MNSHFLMYRVSPGRLCMMNYYNGVRGFFLTMCYLFKKNIVERLTKTNLIYCWMIAYWRRFYIQHFLGVTIDNCLNWNDHINNLASKLSTSLYMIKQISRLDCEPLAIQCYYSYFYSHVTYSIILWRSSNLKNLYKIFVLQ